MNKEKENTCQGNGPNPYNVEHITILNEYGNVVKIPAQYLTKKPETKLQRDWRNEHQTR